ncbi:NADPH-dependent FMN reductase [Dechloromonas sp. A34]|uniref:NADPH-dependent FMN reductase n=1 Tax=Dechloromonas sp. A34 TaxID=447588 RepID=UPI0022494862|nr:NAD(P)H-dependent oxidoreductase [Dechloromonas sp. A34]
MNQISILGIVGSQRPQSYNRFALKAAQALVPDGVTIDLFELHDIPYFAPKHEHSAPPAVIEFRRRVMAADAILFATPECHHAVPGKLKSAIDWASRPYGEGVWRGKPAAVMSASTGGLTTARAQHHLNQILAGLEMPIVDRPGGINGHAERRFSPDGELIDDLTRQFIRGLVAELASLVRGEWAARGFRVKEVA